MKILKLLINFYRKSISPLLSHSCRYYPSCSEYFLRSLDKYGLCKGVIKGVARIARCNQLFDGGYDPVE